MTRYPGHLAAAALLLFVCCDALAHARSESYSHWHHSGTVTTAVVTVPLRDVMLLYQVGNTGLPPGETLREELLGKTAVTSAGTACPTAGAGILQAASGFVRVELHFDCTAPATDIRFRALFDAAPSHVHFARLHRDGRLLAETLLTDAADSWHIGSLDQPGTHTFGSFLRVGIEHIAGGIDHVAFLAGLLLVAGSLRRSVVAVTGFTLGHSASLVAAVLGYVRADGALVEAFIGFTVALVAVEYFVLHRRTGVSVAAVCLGVAWAVGLLAVTLDAISPRSLLTYAGFGVFALTYLVASHRLAATGTSRAWLLLFVATTCFGLVHGFGFAGFLMETGLLGTSLLVPLLGFNLGVEIGQLLLVAAALVLTRLLRGRIPAQAPELLAAGLCGFGVFWFVGRTFS